MKNYYYVYITAILFLTQCQKVNHEMDWALLPFIKVDSINPILEPSARFKFYDPIVMDSVHWAIKDVFNPAAVVRNHKIYLLVRAEDTIGRYNGTSRLGLAESSDGIRFSIHPHPVFYPDNDFMKEYEWEGGCEDPRIVELEDGRYLMTYTSYNGKTARLCIAFSKDLLQWEKSGLAFGKSENGKFRDLWSKSGSIIVKQVEEKFLAEKINGRYWMYWGDTDIFLAWSLDLINWVPLTDKNFRPIPVISPRKGYFDSELVEPGPPAILTENGILLIYNSRNHATHGDKNLPALVYSAGQALFSKSDPSVLIGRLDTSFFKPDKSYELIGQVNQVCFVEGLVRFEGNWFLYYGTADSRIAVAVHPE